MKIARASKKDMKAIEGLMWLLCDVFEDGLLPRNPNIPLEDSEDCTEFDPNERDDLKLLYERIMVQFKIAPGAIRRVVWGFSCIMQSGLMDLECSYLKASKEIERLQKLENEEKS